MTRHDSLTREELFDIFANTRRRAVVQYLIDQGATSDLSPLVEQVAAWENDTTIERLSRDERRRVYISLYQTHLPMLDEHEVINWDADENTVALTVDMDLVAPYVGEWEYDGSRWHWFYVAAAVVGVAGVSLFELGISPFTLLSPLGYAAFAVGVVIVLAIFQYRLETRDPANGLGTAPRIRGQGQHPKTG